MPDGTLHGICRLLNHTLTNVLTLVNKKMVVSKSVVKCPKRYVVTKNLNYKEKFS